MANIKSITKKAIVKETLWNLAVKDDESFVANDIVVHNCKSYLRANLKESKGTEKLNISTLSPTAKAKEGITL